MRPIHSMALTARARTVLWLPLAAFTVGCNNRAPIKVAVADTSRLTFSTPAEAGEALRAAAKLGDRDGVLRILGPATDTLLARDDSAQAIASMAAYSKKYDQMHRWVTMRDSTMVLHIGADNFPFPVPLAHVADARWEFDADAGIVELRARRIGRNELLAMDACTSIANAEELYVKQAHGGNPKGEYAQRILSTEGTQDGLHWETPADQPASPLGRLGDFAVKAVSAPGAPPVFDGYAFRILTAQGSAARGGARNFVVNGRMTGGFAVIASPVTFGESGIMTFMLSREGVLYERNLGPETATAAAAITDYDPADGWNSVPTN